MEVKDTQTKSLEEKTVERLPVIASIKTGLISKDDAIMSKLPLDYTTGTIKDTVDYLLRKKSLTDDEILVATSVDKEMKSRNYVLIVNGRNASLNDQISNYLVQRQEGNRQYQALDMEVSGVQEGGIYLH